MEFIKTNIIGAENVIDAALASNVKNVVALSTDKAAAPINLYGATKLCSDKLFVAANVYRDSAHDTALSVVRYGNVMGSRGSVIPFWKSLADAGLPLPITDLRMTRFWISIEQAVKFVMDSLEIMHGGELYVPRIPSMRIVDLASSVAPNARLEEVGMRPGEKLHEEMISSDDSRRTFLIGERYVVTPVVAEWGFETPKGIPMVEGVAYQSHTNDLWMSQEDIKEFLNEI
jgi:UDP-N-acetylglucosamine 4,6-dehydratase